MNNSARLLLLSEGSGELAAVLLERGFALGKRVDLLVRAPFPFSQARTGRRTPDEERMSTMKGDAESVSNLVKELGCAKKGTCQNRSTVATKVPP